MQERHLVMSLKDREGEDNELLLINYDNFKLLIGGEEK